MKTRNIWFASKNLAALAALAMFLIGVESVRADPIQNVSTGLDSNYNLINSSVAVPPSFGTADAHWTVDDPNYPPAPYSGAAHVVTPANMDWYSGWVANGPNSDWIAVNANVTDNGSAPYTFSTTFDLTGYDLSTVSITGGAWAIDDEGTLNLNGHSLGSLGNGAWGALTSFSTTSSDFVQGVNTLSITITSDDQFLEGVRLEGTVTASPLTSAAPEPASLTLLGIGLTVLGGSRLRRKLKSAR